MEASEGQVSDARPLRVHVSPLEYERHYLATFVEPFSRVLSWLGSPSTYQLSVAGDWVHALGERVVPASLEHADVAVLPVDLEACRTDAKLHGRAVELAAQAAAAGKVMLAFCRGDIEISSPGPNCVVFRTTATRRSLGRCDVMMPAWVADPAATIELGVRPWTAVPRVNFVGFAYPLGVDFGGPARTAAKWLNAAGRGLLTVAHLERVLASRGKRPLPLHRIPAIVALRMARNVDADIGLRQSMTYLDVGGQEQDELHQDFLRRLAASDYTLSVRGEGNYSFRTYESLAVGRPVVSVRTNDVRPCARDVAWDRISIDVPFGRLFRLGPDVRRGHLARREEWEDLQRLCRRSWLESLSAQGFFRRLVTRTSHLADQRALTPQTVAAALA